LKLIIDGYNLLKKILKLQHISLEMRDNFLKRLGVYAQKKAVQILIVFDGGDVSFNYSERVYGIEVIYSGFIDSADDVIMRYIESYCNQEELVAVSSDRQIVDLAASCRIGILKSEEFYDLLQTSEFDSQQNLKINSSNTPNKITSEINPELDSLMEIASRQIKLKDESVNNLRKPSTQKLSKSELQKQRKIRKL
jgi:predicted RNA-binding protein with PIN domain